MNGGDQPPFIVVPDESTKFTDHVLDRGKGTGAIYLGFEPLPETLNRIVLWRVG